MNNMKRLFRYILRSSKYIDFPLLITYLALCFIGLTMVYSASMVAATRGTLTGGIPVAVHIFIRDNSYTSSLVFLLCFLWRILWTYAF